MITALHELRDLLDALEHEPDDQGAMDAAIEIVDRLILQREPPLAIPAVGLCYSVPTPVSPAAAPPPKPRARRPANQSPTLSRKRKKST